MSPSRTTGFLGYVRQEREDTPLNQNVFCDDDLIESYMEYLKVSLIFFSSHLPGNFSLCEKVRDSLHLMTHAG